MIKLIAGLGNPGREYETTRHNTGFMVADLLAEAWNISWRRRSKGQVAEKCGVNKVILLKPQTFMNLSGEAVREVCDFYKIAAEDVLVIYDDLDLSPGVIKARQNGSAGGHNGIKSIISHIGSQNFSRLKIGIGKAPAGWQGKDWVLGRFGDPEWQLVEQALKQAAEAAIYWLDNGIAATMNKFNAKKSAGENKIKKQGEIL